ncbi:hypothetical protein MVEN_02435000 [Mycena venus]|uniref:Uncharacterized protein n=1 Tax=Mycena venus TaxID=2733690 RepID=A0A8H6WYG1_9AGAR|nr:hypothetical protein MVEN_02435000 [Mycena venus]
MARGTKALKARQKNLQKARNSQKATVEEVPDEGDSEHLTLDSENESLHGNHNDHFHSAADNEDNWDLNLGNELPDVDCDDILEEDQEPDLDEEIVVAPEITEETELDAFSQFLFNAQAAAQKAERAQQNVVTRRWGKDLAEKGYLSLFDYIQAKKTAAKLQNTDLDSSAGDGISAAQSPADSQSDSESESGSEDESEPETSTAGAQSTEPGIEIPDCMDPVNLAHVHLKELLEAIQDGSQILDPTPETATDHSLNQLNHKDFPTLRRAAASLSVKSKDKKLDVFFRARITAMAATLNLYLDSQLSYTWWEASMIVSRSQGHGPYHARCIRSWIHAFLTSRKLPLHRYGQYHSSILNDEDFSDTIKLHLQNVSGKDGHFTAQTLVDFVATKEIQQMLEQADIQKRSISVWTARRWLKRLDWRYGRRKNGMYVDGHEREDVVAYRAAFVKRWLERYEPRMVEYDNDGNVKKTPDGYVLEGKLQGQPFRLILVTHDESTFYANDRRKDGWFSKTGEEQATAKG